MAHNLGEVAGCRKMFAVPQLIKFMESYPLPPSQFTIDEFMEKLGISRLSANRYLAELVSLGVLERTGPGTYSLRQSYYRFYEILATDGITLDLLEPYLRILREKNEIKSYRIRSVPGTTTALDVVLEQGVDEKLANHIRGKLREGYKIYAVLVPPGMATDFMYIIYNHPELRGRVSIHDIESRAKLIEIVPKPIVAV